MGDFKSKAAAFFKTEGFMGTSITALVIGVVIAFNAVIYALSSAFGLYLYKEETVDLSLSGSTDALFESAIEEGKKVKISFCMAEENVKYHDTGALVYKTAKYFEQRYPTLVELDFINIITRRNKSGKGELVDLSKYKTDMYGNETKLLKSSVIFECGNNYRVVTDTYTTAGYAPFFTLNSSRIATSYNGEEVMAAMMSWVMAKEHKSAYFTQYHGEVADLSMTNLLASAGYYVNVIDLRKEEIPEDADLVVISNPTGDFEAARDGSGIRSEIDRLDTYISRGGNLYVSLDPYVKSLPVLEGFLAASGIKFTTEKTAAGSTVRTMVKDTRNAITTDGFTLVTEYADNVLAKNIAARVSKYTDGSVIVREASALTLSGEAKPLLVTSSAAVLEADGKTVSRAGSYCVAAYADVPAENGSSKIFVVPSIYLAVSDSLITNGYSNKDFMYALFEDFYGAENMPYGCRAVVYDNQILENLTMGRARFYTVLTLMIPVAIAAVGAVVIIRRKNR